VSEWVAALERASTAAVDLAWGLPLVGLLIGAGLYFSVMARFLPLRRLGHALDILRGRYDDPDAPGEIPPYQALASALSATIGMGNIAGVAIAVTVGGPGSVFWMWVAGLLGMATKYFTCTLACMYRKPDSRGVDQGGPMYFIEVGLGPRWRPLAMFFAACGMVGCLSLFQINQLAGLLAADYAVPEWATGLTAMLLVGVVILGGIARLGRVAALVVPAMGLLYVGISLVVLVGSLDAIPGLLAQVVSDAFTGGAALGGATGVTVREAMVTGVQRAAFSNEAGIGTAPMAHGAARTAEPVREGLIAMLGPFIDTNIVCTLTALVILASGVTGSESGVLLTTRAFESALPGVGAYLLAVVIVLFSLSTMLSYSYYSQKCARYLFGERLGGHYVWVYLGSLPLAAVFSQSIVLNVLDTAFALMAIPTLTAALLLSPRVLAATRDYFARMNL
jgi:AGCS family alanine or glycine:cation symporter